MGSGQIDQGKADEDRQNSLSRRKEHDETATEQYRAEQVLDSEQQESDQRMLPGELCRCGAREIIDRQSDDDVWQKDQTCDEHHDRADD